VAYVAILGVILIASLMGLAFVHSVATHTALSADRNAAMQARYLAESAANHALWRLLYENTSTIEMRVVHDHDDGAEKSDGSMDIDAPQLELGKQPLVGVRIPNVVVPPGAQVFSAYVQFVAKDDDSASTDLRILGEYSGASKRFTKTDYDLSSRTQTGASVDWIGVPKWAADGVYRTPDLAAIVQEVVDHPGWKLGAELTLLFESADLNGQRRPFSHNGSPEDAPLLNVTYRDSGGDVADFPEAEDVYYLHDLAGGRYGYKVRPHTDTTFATIASVGALGEALSEQSHVLRILPPTFTSDVLSVYAPYSVRRSQYARLRDPDWTSIGGVMDTYAWARWIELAGRPQGSEVLLGTVDDSSQSALAVWDGADWGSKIWFSSYANDNFPCLALAYETLSREGLVVGRHGSGDDPYYTRWNGSSWAHDPPLVVSTSATGAVQHVDMASNPLEDEMLACVTHDADGTDGHISLLRWDGNAFEDLGLLTTDSSDDNYEPAAVIYEQRSGEALITYATPTSLRYRTWNGSALSSDEEVLAMDKARILRLAPHPTSEYVLLAAVDDHKDLHVAVWDGDAWIESAVLEDDLVEKTLRCFDVVWEFPGEEALILWSPNGSNAMNYVRWTVGEALGSLVVEIGPTFSDSIRTLRAQARPDSTKIAVLACTNGTTLEHTLWSGDSFVYDPPEELCSELAYRDSTAYDLTAWDYWTDRPPFVDAGRAQTTQHSVETALDGTVRHDGLPDPPGAVTTEWSLVSGPGGLTIEDASQVDTIARFQALGDYVLRLTGDDGAVQVSDEVTITVDNAPPYVEKHESWTITSSGVWQVVDLSGSPYDVPPNAVLEVALSNARTDQQYYGGVRARGSALSRRLRLHEPEGDGRDVAVMHVQADADSRIECCAENHGEVDFTLLGYWTQGTYVETWTSYQNSTSGSWESRNLAPAGVGPSQVAEIVIYSIDDYAEHLAGVRPIGFAGGDRLVELQEAESGGRDTATMLVTADATANAAVELWAADSADVRFAIAGYWSVPPSTYTEAALEINSPSGPPTSATWWDLHLAALGVPADAVVQIACANESHDKEQFLGVRQTGSSLERSIELHEAEDGGADWACLQVVTDESSTIQWFDEDVSTTCSFHLLGWWDPRPLP